jgi:transcription initiation factor TFIIIB Brf1 subunit/transcription initiation factor TFIIB
MLAEPIEEEGFKNYSQYTQYAIFEKSLKNSSFLKNFGESIFDAVLNECKNIIVKDLMPKRWMLRKQKEMLAAITYKVLRQMGKPVILEEIANLFNVSKWELAKCFRSFYRGERIPLPSVRSYIKRYIADLHLPEELEEKAMQIYEENENVLRRFPPSSSAAACLYLVGKEYGVKEEEVAREAKRAVFCIRRIMKTLKSEKSNLL